MATKQTLSFIPVVIVLAWAPLASAQVPVTWSAPGATGIVDEADQKIVQFNSTGSVSIKRSARGTLDLRYQIGPFVWVPQEGDCPELRANLRDTGPGARVIARLMRLGIGGEAVVGELTPIAEIDSDTFPTTASNQYITHRACLNGGPGHTLEFTYYVDVQLIKSAATANPGLLSLQICPSQDACDP